MKQFCQQCQVEHKTLSLLGGERVFYCQRVVLPTINQIDSEKWGSNMPSSKSTRSMEAIQPKKKLDINFNKQPSYSANAIDQHIGKPINRSFLKIQIQTQKQINRIKKYQNPNQDYYPKQQRTKVISLQTSQKDQNMLKRNMQNQPNQITNENKNGNQFTHIFPNSFRRVVHNLKISQQLYDGRNLQNQVVKSLAQNSLINSLKCLSAYKLNAQQQRSRENLTEVNQGIQSNQISVTKSIKCQDCTKCFGLCYN